MKINLKKESSLYKKEFALKLNLKKRKDFRKKYNKKKKV